MIDNFADIISSVLFNSSNVTNKNKPARKEVKVTISFSNALNDEVKKNKDTTATRSDSVVAIDNEHLLNRNKSKYTPITDERCDKCNKPVIMPIRHGNRYLCQQCAKEEGLI